ncbi:MAG: hypothetical protein JSW04_12375 [Desulfobacterales bacterium]|nr:MAG: hypothetical protein JSW04_12375 [Desulfobacterales bacterium]
MDDNRENNKIITRFEDLVRQRKKIFSSSSEHALDAILDSSQPAALVHSFSEEDFFFLIHDIGIEDSYQLLTLASDRQWEYIVDLETWEKDRIELASVTRWFDLLFKVDPSRFIRWFLEQKTEFIEYYLYKNIEVKIRETDQDPSDFGDAFFTLDDIFYIRFLDDSFYVSPHENGSDKDIKAQREAFLFKFLKMLSAFDHVTYQKILMESSSLIPAETEEEEYRLRSMRLAEKGFLPYEEAIGLYQPLSVKQFKKKSPKFTTKDPERKLLLPLPIYPTGMIEKEHLFANALKRIDIDDILEQVQNEFAGLCNRLVAADQKTVREKEKLKPIVQKACGYINIGLEGLIEDDGVFDVNRCSKLIQKYSLANIFKVGYGYALNLKWHAEKWQKKSWFGKEGLLISFWGEEWLGVLGGLLLNRPMFYDNYKTGVLYRDFIAMEDIRKTEKALNEIIAFDDLFSKMNITPEPIVDGFLTHKNLILTIWARHYLGLSVEPLALSVDELHIFFDDLWEIADPPRHIRLIMKEKFLTFLSDQTGQSNEDISRKLGYSLENLFNELESEYGKIAIKDLDPKYIHLFLVNRAP